MQIWGAEIMIAMHPTILRVKLEQDKLSKADFLTDPVTTHVQTPHSINRSRNLTITDYLSTEGLFTQRKSTIYFPSSKVERS